MNKKLGVFDFVADISHKKEYIFNQETAGQYNVYITNKVFSYHIDTIHLVNKINQYPFITKKMHYDFLFNSVRPRKRYATWNKYEDDKNLELVKNYYKYNTHRAKEALRLLTKEDLKDIEDYLDVGGI